MGKGYTPEQQQKMYQPTKLYFTEELQQVLSQYQHCQCHVIEDIPDIPTTKTPFTKKINDFQPILAELRLLKDAVEISDLEESCTINAKAFNYVMAHLKPGMKEYEAEAMHAYIYLKNGSKCSSFCAITASGSNASTLHFVKNENQIQDKSTFLLDAGCEVRNACSDHTRTFPTGARFTHKQEQLYKIVLKCNKDCIAMIKPGIKWEDVHFLGLRILLEGLREVGIINNKEDLETQHQLGIASIFQPHGLGHMLGLNTHDVGGYNATVTKCTTDHRIKYLRTRRTLEEGMVITVEPGLYFIDGFINDAKNDPAKAKHLNFDLIEQYRKECGGYRIEDDVVVTKDSHHVLPGAVKELDEIYALRALAFIE